MGTNEITVGNQRIPLINEYTIVTNSIKRYAEITVNNLSADPRDNFKNFPPELPDYVLPNTLNDRKREGRLAMFKQELKKALKIEIQHRISTQQLRKGFCSWRLPIHLAAIDSLTVGTISNAILLEGEPESFPAFIVDKTSPDAVDSYRKQVENFVNLVSKPNIEVV